MSPIMKKISLHFTFATLLSFQLYAQDMPLDPSFLTDLPPELAETLLNNAEQRDDKVEPFRSPKSSFAFSRASRVFTHSSK